MDYGFTDVEVVEIYLTYKKLIAECEALKRAGSKVSAKETALYNSIIAKLLAKHPQLGELP